MRAFLEPDPPPPLAPPPISSTSEMGKHHCIQVFSQDITIAIISERLFGNLDKWMTIFR